MQRLERLGRAEGTLSPARTLPVVASLPQNTTEYSVAAQEAGADAVVVSVNKTENAFPGLFADFEYQEKEIAEAISVLNVPVGIAIGDAKPLAREMWEKIAGHPFSFVSMFAHHMPLFVLEDSRIEKFVSVGPGYMLEQVKSISQFDQVGAIEAALISAQARSNPLNLLDLSTIRLIAGLSAKPVFLRTQKRTGAGDTQLFQSAGVRGLVLDSAVLETGVQPFAEALRELKTPPALGSSQATL